MVGVGLQSYVHNLRANRPAYVQTGAAPGTAQAAPPMVSGGSIAWEGSFESAQARARDTRRPMMIDFYTDWCPACKYLESDTFPSPQVVAESQYFVNVRVNAEGRTDLAQQFGVSKYPTLIFLDANGNTVNRFEGGYPPDEFAQQMRSARSQAGT